MATWQTGTGEFAKEDDLNFLDDEQEVVSSTTETTDPPIEEQEQEIIPAATTVKNLETEADFDELEDEVEGGEQEVVQQNQPVSIDAVYLRAKAEQKAEQYGIELEDGIEWTDDVYLDFENKLDDFRLEQKYSELKKVTPEIEALLDVAENDGDITKLIEIYGARKELKEIDTSTVDGKIELIKRYWKDVENKKPEWIDKYVKRLQVSEDPQDIEEEFTSVNEAYNKHFSDKTAKAVSDAENERVTKERRIQAQRTNFSTVLKTKSFKEDEIQKLSDFVYNDKAFYNPVTKENLSSFDAAIINSKKDPEKLAELVSYLSDPELFKKKIQAQKTTAATETKFRKITQSASPESAQPKTPAKPGFNFNIQK